METSKVPTGKTAIVLMGRIPPGLKGVSFAESPQGMQGGG